MLNISDSRTRQARLRAIMAERNLDAVVAGARHHAYYLSAHLPFWQHEGAIVLLREGPAVLLAANTAPAAAAADTVLTYEAQFHYTFRQEQAHVVGERIAALLDEHKANSIGVDTSPITAEIAIRLGGACTRIDEELWQLRRRKDPDELVLMQKAIACAEAMYARAREIIRPGIAELEVYGALHATAVEAAGEPLSAWLGNDYRCAAMGGPPRDGRRAAAGEMYILDLAPAYRGYFSDSARAFAVDGNPTTAQQEVRSAILEVLDHVASLARPGASCRELYAAASDLLQARTGHGMIHHLGHGVGLQPHEYPHLNPAWDDTLLEGEVFAMEPGVYGPELGGGIRIENQYRVTADGAVNLLDVSTELA